MISADACQTALKIDPGSACNTCTPIPSLTGSNLGSDSLSLIFGGGVVLFSKGKQQHGEEFGPFVPDAGRSGR